MIDHTDIILALIESRIALADQGVALRPQEYDLLRESLQHSQPSTPFDPEPQMFDVRPLISYRELDQERALHERYNRVRRWHDLGRRLMATKFGDQP